MRPLLLRMSAFGPYKKEETIELEKLGTEGLYLITGDTGAGKTTIFDGITYALYGQASGSNRTAAMFRSKYASPDTPTEVELQFSYRGKRYRIKRNPEYERPAKKGTGMTTEKASAELYLPDGSVITKLKEVDQKIVEILGVNYAQFTEIAMISQGDFLKLLVAETKERQQIFRKLFRTEYYQTLQEKLKAAALEARDEVRKFVDARKQYVAGILPDTGDEDRLFREYACDPVIRQEASLADGGLIPDEWRNAESTSENTSENTTEGFSDLPDVDVISYLETLRSRDEKREQSGTTIKECYEKHLEILNLRLGKVEEYEKQRKLLDTGRKTLETEIERYNKAKEELATWKAREPEKENLSRKIAEMEAKLPEYARLTKLQEERSESEKTLHEETITNQTNLVRKEQLEKELQNDREAQKRLQHADTELAEIQHQMEKAKEKEEQLKTLSGAIREWKKVCGELYKKQEDYIAASETHRKLQGIYETQNRAFLDEQAGILAATLLPEVACPVCGSLEHPSPAELKEDAPTEEMIRKAKKKAEEAREKAEQLATESHALRGTETEKRESIARRMEELLPVESAVAVGTEDGSNVVLDGQEARIDEALQHLTVELNEWKRKRSDAEKQVAIRTALEKKIPELDETLKQLEQIITESAQKIAGLDEKRKGLEKQVEEGKMSLPFAGEKEAKAETERLRKDKKNLEDSIEKAMQTEQKAATEVSRVRGQVAQLEQQLQESTVEEKDAERLREEKSSVTGRLANLQKALQELHTRRTTNAGILTKITTLREQTEKVEKKWQWMQDLSDTANGSVSGREKLMLETYIQTTYFDRILRRVNVRLMIMSEGQYEMCRQRDSGNRKTQSGLEIDVIDHYNVTERSVKSLSGGESFMASLSLALGLSDEIQSSAGGIQLDTMFVDEGFGTLDEEALQQALNALQSLTAGHRLVGIISHVGELKNRIDKQIIVRKDREEGSHIEALHVG